MAFWLVKSEPDVYSIDELEADKVTRWDCVRNYEARNNLRTMAKGDGVLFYHSNAAESGIVGLARVVKTAVPDPTQFDSKSEYFDPKASAASPRWFSPEIGFVKKFPKTVSLAELKKEKALNGMVLLKRGTRLSVQPISEKEFTTIVGLSKRA